jgi:integrase
LERKARLEEKGLSDPIDEQRQKPLSAHIDAYKGFLKSKGNTAAHCEKAVSRIRVIVEGCKFKRINDISASAVTEYLAKLRHGDDGVGISTSNHYLTAMKAFCNWLVQDRRTTENALAYLSRLNAQVDVRRKRRALSSEEFGRLVRAAEKGKAFGGLDGRDRAILYIVATYTGLRAQELASLVGASFEFSPSGCVVTVKAAYSKRRREDRQPLPASVAKMVRAWMAEKGIGSADHLWPGRWYERGAEIVHADLETAGIAYKDARGHVYDFHALRHQYITDLYRSGAHPKTVQELARHSTVTLSLDQYTHAGAEDLTGALEKLAPVLGHSVQELYKDLSVPGDVELPRVALNDAQEESEVKGNEVREVLAAEQVGALLLLMSLLVANRPGRNRTYDQGIMSPLL